MDVGKCYYSHHKIAVGAEKAFQISKISSHSNENYSVDNINSED